ncbi:polysaccharide lyase family 4 protein [Paramyrothecium foliicola]|nr:polysaccharide lyase family 4 protein [Paramyrothecium foliicola]
MMFQGWRVLPLVILNLTQVLGLLTARETADHLILENDQLHVAVSKKTGQMVKVDLEGQDLVGKGRGTYLDCSCTPEGFWSPEARAALGWCKEKTAMVFHMAFMWDGERCVSQDWAREMAAKLWNGHHTYTRVTYFNETQPVLRQLQEMRTCSDLTPTSGPTSQDATNYLGGTPEDPLMQSYSDFFTKYSFADQWRNHKAQGMFADGSTSNGKTYGAWVVHNTVDTYYGGPLQSDFMADGILYNYIVRGHHGNQRPMLVHGFDQTFGPNYHHFNKGGSLEALAEDAASYADADWNMVFYDAIAKHVPNTVTSKERGVFKAHVALTEDSSGSIVIPRVIEGTYRLTVYADGILGWFIQDEVQVKLGCQKRRQYTWSEESAGPGAREIWRIGTPDKSSGESRRGDTPTQDKTLHPPEYRQYWAQFDFGKDFPDVVHFKVGESDVAKDLNYVHWSVFSDKSNYFRDEPLYENVNNWTVTFHVKKDQLDATTKGVFTPYVLNVNGKDVATYMIPPEQGSSCVFRSAVACHQWGFKLDFEASHLKDGENEFILSLPFNATSIETAELPWTTYVHRVLQHARLLTVAYKGQAEPGVLRLCSACPKWSSIVLFPIIWALSGETSPARSRTATSRSVKLHVPREAPKDAQTVPIDYMGYSIVYDGTVDYAGNKSFSRTLQEASGKFPIIRAGGSPQNRAFFVDWQAEAFIRTYPPIGGNRLRNFTIGPAWLESFQTWPGVPRLVGLSFEDGELGFNQSPLFQACSFLEPEHVGTDLSYWNVESALRLGIDDGGRVQSVADHKYAGSVCADLGLPIPEIGKTLLGHHYTTNAMYRHEYMGNYTYAQGMPYVMGETGTVSCHGMKDVSDTYASALWAVDYLLYLASLKISRVFFHQGKASTTALGSPWPTRRRALSLRPAPCTTATCSQPMPWATPSHKLPCSRTNPSFVAYGIYDVTGSGCGAPGTKRNLDDSTLKSLVVLNLEQFDSTQAATERTRLTGPGAEVKEDITFAGQSVDKNGSWVGTEHVEKLCNGKVVLGASEAVLITLK